MLLWMQVEINRNMATCKNANFFFDENRLLQSEL